MGDINLTSIKRILESCANIKDIGIVTNKREIADLKKAYCYLANKYTNATYQQICDMFVKYDHSTVSYSIKTFSHMKENLTCYDAYLKADKKIREISSTKSSRTELDEMFKKLDDMVEKLDIMVLNVKSYNQEIKNFIIESYM